MSQYIVNSSDSGATFNARIYNISDDSDATLSSAEYPQTGVVDLSAGKGLDTQYIPKVGDGIYWIQSVDFGVSYNIYALHIKAGDLVDVYVGDQDTPIVLSEADKPYMLPTESWKILEAIPEIVKPSVTSYVAHIAFSRTTPPVDLGDNVIDYPVGVYGNDYLYPITGNATEHDLVDFENNPTTGKIRFQDAFTSHSRTNVSATEVDALTRHQMCNVWTGTTDKYLELYLTAGTYTLDISSATQTPGNVTYTFNNDATGDLETIYPQANKVTFSDYIITTDGWYKLDIINNVSISGIDITKTA